MAALGMLIFPLLPLNSHIRIVYQSIMLFRRKKPATWSGKLREFLWPRKGFSRGLRYLSMRVLRLSSSPHLIAAGVAAGAASSATPFVGFHILIALAFAYLLSGNMIAAGISTALANPLTIPFILAGTYGAWPDHARDRGQRCHGRSGISSICCGIWSFPICGDLCWKPMLIGSLPLAAASAAVFYVAAFYAARLFQSRSSGPPSKQVARTGRRLGR